MPWAVVTDVPATTGSAGMGIGTGTGTGAAAAATSTQKGGAGRVAGGADGMPWFGLAVAGVAALLR